MNNDTEFTIEEVETIDDSEQCLDGLDDGKSSKPNRFKQTLLDNFIPGSLSSAVCLSTPPNRKRPNKGRKPFKVRKSVVVAGDGDDKQSLIQKNPGTSSCVVVVHESFGESGACGSSAELSRMGETIKKARRNSLYGYLGKMAQECSTDKNNSSRADVSTVGKEETIKTDLERFRSFVDIYPDLHTLSQNDHVFIEVDSITSDSLPKPYPPFSLSTAEGREAEWSDNSRYVRLPFAPNCSGYTRIKAALTEISTPLNSYLDLERCLKSIFDQQDCNVENVKHYFNEVLNNELRSKYLQEVIPFMARLALAAPTLITKPIPVLRQGSNSSITLSQQQVAVLLSHAFFCTYGRSRAYGCSLPAINFRSFFDKRNRLGVEKLHCILHYFRCIYEKMPFGVITYRRQSRTAPNWRNLENPLSEFVALTSGTIEDDGFGMLEMDFANKYIGGGVLRHGCVQEEIRFLICPELIASCLFCEKMDVNEAIIISGAQRYSNYTGYGRGFKWQPLKVNSEELLRDQFGRHLREVVAIDALSYRSTEKQYEIGNVNRELQKAYIGFYDPQDGRKGIATGNWGCGVYRGDPQLKSLLQLIAASANHKPVCYFTFFNQALADELNTMYNLLRDRKITIGRLYQLICRFCSQRGDDSRPLFTRIAEWI